MKTAVAKSTVDLESVDPRGRLDVLIYRGIENILKGVEQTKGIAGLWDAAKPLANQYVGQYVSGFEPPPEVKMILAVVQANMKGKTE